jgi:ribosomal protein S18 acetylase RimI-like enzyme
MSAVRVRTGGPSDCADIARLNRLFNGAEDSPEAYAARLADPRRVDTLLLAELAGGVVGIAVLRLLQPVFYREPYAEVTELYVEESARRQGVGRALMATAGRLAREAGAEEITLLTNTENEAALRFYHALGFELADVSLVKRLREK